MAPFIGEVRMFAGNFAPAGWMFCEGQLVPISENDALFALIGTTYGGDGQETFALPDLRGRIPVHMGTGPSGTYQLGENGGVEQVTLTTQQIPVHTHTLLATTNPGQQSSPIGLTLANTTGTDIYSGDTPVGQMSNQAIVPVGGSQPHDNMQPFLCISYIISLFGVFPPQN
jgi:microcystin-dependent protein